MFAKGPATPFLTHLFFVTLFLVVPTVSFVRLPGEPFFAFTRVVVQDTLANLVSLLFFYLNYYILVEKYLLKERYGLYALYTVVFLGVALTIPHLVGSQVPDTPDHPLPRGARLMEQGLNEPRHGGPVIQFMIMEFRRHLFLFFSAVFFSLLLRTREHLARVREEKLEAELSSLKAQINPHFLFNTLNSIYALAVKKDDKASEAIIHLSGLMRYVITEANGYKIPLGKELDYLGNYIGLQKARLGKTADIRFECSGEPGSLEITPLILITFIENAFKYGVNPDRAPCLVEINLQVTGKGIRLYTYNRKAALTAVAHATGIGLKNTGERLKHLYPGKHTLEITENSETYAVTLLLELI